MTKRLIEEWLPIAELGIESLHARNSNRDPLFRNAPPPLGRWLRDLVG